MLVQPTLKRCPHRDGGRNPEDLVTEGFVESGGQVGEKLFVPGEP
jgi:hypothetical protein